MCKEMNINEKLKQIGQETLKRVVEVEKKTGMPAHFEVPNVVVPKIKIKFFKAK